MFALKSTIRQSAYSAGAPTLFRRNSTAPRPTVHTQSYWSPSPNEVFLIVPYTFINVASVPGFCNCKLPWKLQYEFSHAHDSYSSRTRLGYALLMHTYR